MNNCWSCVHVFAAIWVRSPSSRIRNSWSSWSWALIPMEPWSWSWKTCGRGWRSPTSCSSRCSRRVAMWNISLKWLDVTDPVDFFLPFCSLLFLFTKTLFSFGSPVLQPVRSHQCQPADPVTAGGETAAGGAQSPGQFKGNLVTWLRLTARSFEAFLNNCPLSSFLLFAL